jgi:2,4-dienoyl-CoA reductase-like NADH-dependent reductase (Old Yellow Enzyme family)
MNPGKAATPLLQPISMGNAMSLRNRICMSSMTRNRCVDNNEPGEAVREHYTTRAKDGTGLIIAEGTFIYLSGCDWLYAPVMYTEKHAQAWRKVTDSVHQAGGKILFQAWHPGKSLDNVLQAITGRTAQLIGWDFTGRCQNENMPMLKESGYPVLAPSKIPAKGGKYHALEGMPVSLSRITTPSSRD